MQKLHNFTVWKKRFNAQLLFNLLSRIFKLYQDVPPTDITLSWKKHSQSISVLSCSVQLFWNRLDSYYKVLYDIQFRLKKEQFLLNLPSARNSKTVQVKNYRMYIWMIRIYQMMASRVRNGPGNWMRGIDQISRGQPLSRRAFPGLISQISKVTTKQNLKYHSLKFHPCRSELNYLFLGVIFHNEREIEIQKEMGEDTEVVDRYMYIYQ